LKVKPNNNNYTSNNLSEDKNIEESKVVHHKFELGGKKDDKAIRVLLIDRNK
jgi:hypothetical protein